MTHFVNKLKINPKLAKLIQLAFRITKVAHRAFGTNPFAYS